MSFEKIEDLKQEIIHERSCMILYNFTPNELGHIQNVARLTGIRDQIILRPNQSQTIIRDILDDQFIEGEVGKVLDKTIILNAVSTQKMNAFLEALKKYRMPRPLIAVVTSHSINWTLEELLMNLREEREALKNNKNTVH